MADLERFHREPIIDPDDGQTLGHIDQAAGVPPLYGERDQLVHTVTWVTGGGTPWTSCAIAVRADWLLVPIGTPILDGARQSIEPCEACAHPVVAATAGAPSRVIEGTATRMIEGTATDA